MRRIAIIAGALASLSLAGSPVLAQTAGKGGTGVDENTELPRCAQPLGVVALVEEKAPSPTDGLAGELSPGMAALLRMAEAQQGGGTARVDPLPLIKLMAARSNCFRVADRGAAMGALERERAMTGNAPSQSLVKADYLISAQVLYSDAKSRESGGGLGGAFGSAVGLKTKTLESQVLLSLIDVDTGLQEAVATGSARKKDVGVVGGGLLLGLGVGALGGTYGSTDIGNWFPRTSPVLPGVANFTQNHTVSEPCFAHRVASATLRFPAVCRLLLPPCFPGHAAPAWGSRWSARGPPEFRGNLERNDAPDNGQIP